MGAWRATVIARIERDVHHRRPVGPDGFIVGAAAIDLPRPGAPAVLLLHGGGDTPQTLRGLAESLHARGYAVHVPVLAGHGRTIRDFRRVTAEGWLRDMRVEYDALLAESGWVAVIGLSMGGALAVSLAAERRELPALGLIAPYLSMPRAIRAAARAAPVWGIVVPLVRSGGGRSIWDPDAAQQNLAYGVFSSVALHALYRTVQHAAESLPKIESPTLMVQSKDDNRIPRSDAQRSFDQLGARDKELVWVEGAGHVLTVDYGREQLFTLFGEWLDSRRSLTRASA